CYLSSLQTVQIIIGLMDFLFGIIMVLHVDTVAVVSGAFTWGALIMDTAVGFNVLAGAASAVTNVIYILDAFGFSMIHCNSLMVRH
ncbi:hypothetical protein GBF38_013715, partial [Nibea albiflora]